MVKASNLFITVSVIAKLDRIKLDQYLYSFNLPMIMKELGFICLFLEEVVANSIYGSGEAKSVDN